MSKNKQYQQYFRESWLTQTVFKDWLSEVPDNPRRARCSYCNCEINARQADLLRHYTSKKHQLKARNVSDCNNGINSDLMKNFKVEEDELPGSYGVYMDDNESVDVQEMTESLIQNYKEYKHKKPKQFSKSVKKAYQWELENRRNNSNTTGSECDSSEIEIEDDDGGGPDIIEMVEHKKNPRRNSERNGLRGKQLMVKRERSSGEPMIEFVSAEGASEQAEEAMFRQRQHKKAILEQKTPTKTPSKRVRTDANGTPAAQTPSSARSKKLKVEVPFYKLDDMEGIDPIKMKIFSLIKSLVYKGGDVEFLPHSAILTGPEGSGKTMLAKAIAGCAGAFFIHFSAVELVGGASGESDKRIKEAFRQAKEMTPSVLLIDKLSIVSPKDGPNSRNSEKRLCSQIAECVNDLKENFKETRVIVLAEARQSEDIDWILRSAFRKDISMPALTAASRKLILNMMCPNVGIDMFEISQRTPGFVAGDLRKLIEGAMERAHQRSLLVPGSQGDGSQETLQEEIERLMKLWRDTAGGNEESVTLTDFLEVLPEIVPTLKREGFPCVPHITWEDIGGLDEIKAELREKILDPIKYPDIHRKYGVGRPNGILLWGPPGCGKTLLAKALANEAGINFLAVGGPEILSMYQGESERKIREIFLKARSVAPCVVFFDEFDGICPLRTKGSESGSRTTIVHTLLVELNGFTSREEVYVVGATNRPDMLDPAVTRPGRFDTLLYVGLPDLSSRVSVLNSCSKKGTCPKFGLDINLTEIAKKLEGYSGADCSNLINLASLAAIKEESANRDINHQDTGIKSALDLTETCNNSTGTVYNRHMTTAINRIRRSVSTEALKKYLRLKRRFETYIDSGLSGEQQPSFIDELDDVVTVEINENAPTTSDTSTDREPVCMGS